jgi:D-alanyl-D-alanine carboxypeptidase
MKAVALVVSLLCVSNVSCAPAGSLEAASGKMMERGWPGIGLLLERADGTVAVATAGMESIEQSRPLTRATAFHICSITKTFTAAAILQLVDQGKLHLDDKVTAILDQPVVKRIPDIAEVSVRQLLDHSSGIYPTNNDSAYLQTLIGAGALSGRVWTPDELIELATRAENKPTGKPGAAHSYSDTNYILLGMIVAKVSGRPYQDQIARTLLAPLGMKHTYFYSNVVAATPAPPGVASGYIKLTKDLTDAVTFNPAFAKPRPGWLNAAGAAERIDAAAGLVSTLDDLHKFAAALFRGKLLSPASQAFLFAVREDMPGVALGKSRTGTLQSVNTSAGLVIFKEGDGPGGYNTVMAFHPQSGAIFLGYTNQFGDFNEVEALLNEALPIALQAN